MRAGGMRVHRHCPWAALAVVYPSLLLGTVNSCLSLKQRCCWLLLLFSSSAAEPCVRLVGGRDTVATSASCSSLSLSANTTTMSAHCPLLQDECVGGDTLSHREDRAHQRRELLLWEVMYLGEPGFVGHQLLSYWTDMFGWFNAGCGCIRLAPKEETKRKPCLRVAQHHDVEANWSIWEHEGIIWWSG